MTRRYRRGKVLEVFNAEIGLERLSDDKYHYILQVLPMRREREFAGCYKERVRIIVERITKRERGK